MLLCINVNTNAGNPVISPRATGAGGCSILSAGCWSVFANPSGLAGVINTEAGLMCLGNYLLPECAAGYASACIPTSSGNIGAGFGAWGNRHYNESRFIFSYARNIGENLYAGISFNHFRLNQSSYTGTSSLTVPSAGLTVRPGKNLSFSLCIFNPAGQQFRGEGKCHKVSGTITAGLAFKFGEEALLCGEATFTCAENTIYRTGVEFYATSVITVRAGIAFTSHAEPSAGIGIKSGHTSFDIGLRRHPVLGFSPSISFLFIFSDK